MSVPLFDAHCDSITRPGSLAKNRGQLDLQRLGAYAPAAQVFAVFSPPPLDTPAVFSRLLKRAKRKIEQNADRVALCRTAEEIHAAHSGGRAAAILSVEGAAMLGCSCDGLRAAWSEGVRLVNLTWNKSNCLAGAAMDADPHGLTDEGREFVRCAQSLGVTPELSHISDTAFWDVVDITTKPLLVGHSNSRAICPHPRNLTDDMFSAVIRSGGCIGLNLCPDFVGGGRDIDAVLTHAEHFLRLGGEKALCLGCDLDGIPRPPKGIDGVQDLAKLYEAMLARGWGEALAQDIFFNNLMRFMEAVL